MQRSIYRITLDMKSIQTQVTLPVNVGDTSRTIYISLVEGILPYTIGKGCRAVFTAIKPDGTDIVNNCIIENNMIRYDLTEQTVATPGLIDCEVRLYGKDGGVITSPRFDLVVDSRVVRDGKVVSSSEHTLIDGIVNAEIERQKAEEERQKFWNTVLDSPKVWELDSGLYRVSGMVSITTDGVAFWVEKESLLHVTADENGNRFILHLAHSGGLHYEFVTGTTDGTTSEWYGVESEKMKVYEINSSLSHEGYTSPKAVVDYVASVENDIKTSVLGNTITATDFGAVGDGVTDDTAAIKKAFLKLTDNGIITLPKGHYIIKPTANKQSLIKLTGLKNVTIDLNGSTLEVATNGYTNYNLFELVDCENFVLTNGFLKGDRLTHDYTTTSGTHEFGYAIYCGSSLTSWYPNIGTPSETLKCCGVISNLKISDFTGDGIVSKNGMSPGKIEVLNCEIHHCRRQGISVLDADVLVVDGCHIHHIGNFDGVNGASPMSGIDIEPGSGTCSANLVEVRNTTIENTSNESIIAGQKVVKDSNGKITEIKSTVKEVLIDNCRTDNIILQQYKSFDVSTIETTDIVIKNSILNHRKTFATGNRCFTILNALILNCVVNALGEYSGYTDLFISGDYPSTLKNCVVNLFDTNARIAYIKLLDSTVNGGILYIHESSPSTMRDCTNVEFNNCKFSINNVQGLYKFVGCSFRNCTPWTTSKPIKFRNCYLDSRYVPGADYVNCIIEDEIGVEA